MKTRNAVAASAIGVALMLSIFIALPIQSFPASSEFNPWADLNSNGTVDIFDAIMLANSFGTSGSAINKSEIALSGFTSKPAWDSGWINIEQGGEIQLYHNLNTTDLLIYMIGKDNGLSKFIHQFDYGGDSNTLKSGAWWGNLTATSIMAYRGLGDPPTVGWDQIRILIWVIPI